ncbi:hypothetical protein [Leifsonia sp. WHRI 6310E]|uniref:hypothetical protein n=1 Tax=Leifsonia sp. WHRI 6310E TaxID=3162562 RepID=UPI0032EC30A0
MAGRAIAEVEGADRFRRTLRKAGIDLKNLRNVHKSVGAIVATAAARLAPRRTNRLANNIRAGATQKAAFVRAGGARVPYAGPVHWGWPKHHIPANPFMTTAAQETEPRWFRVYEDYTTNALDYIEGK